MKSHSIRLIVIIAALSVLGIVLTQSYWLNRAFGLQEKQFDQQVQIALNRVAEQLLAWHQLPLPMENPITRVSSNYYAVMVNNPIEASLLEDLLVREFSRSNLTADFEYGIYDCQTEKLVYGSMGRSFDLFISRLRKYLQKDERTEILNVHGIGFKLLISA